MHPPTTYIHFYVEIFHNIHYRMHFCPKYSERGEKMLSDGCLGNSVTYFFEQNGGPQKFDGFWQNSAHTAINTRYT